MVQYRPAARVAALPPNFFGAMDREIAKLAAEPGPRVINVSKGNPDLPTPEAIVTAMQAAVASPSNHRYPAYLPRPKLAEAIALRYRDDHGVDIDPATEVAIFHGSHEGIMAGIVALAGPGAAVVLPDPGYPAYASAVQLAEARAVTLPLVPPTYQPDLTALDGLEGAAVLVLNYPNNPTGALARPETFVGAGEAARRLGAVLLHDFAYASLGFDGRRPLSALAIDRGHEVTVELSTLSKTYSMAGWRFGYAAGNASAIAAMRAYQVHAFSTIFGATQDAATAALTGSQDAAAELVAIYERRRDLVVEGLRRIGWEPESPEGSFFVWVPVPGGGDDVAFTQRLQREARVAVAPGSGFGAGGAGHIRLGLVHDEATLAELIDRLAAFGAAPTTTAVP
ncbi:aminotransferase class I/II-fold pyridoxal phosphate-dependent enzyme [Galbitalea sp. SE-J8]|uniref:aminotransferase class I/II-fold pyridoxal phosphate-dependent enzyme n=1 Tax=Galbitalea sp. SE-J8 TaxID=3054952 RepID=UPI00259C69CA|nr:aminotransferase class I/II-fold pyridoxal phosphate-dependent enzyme [Galbitalea sp. SE-J8]MDM4763695.1 aminotransferase class I/II-fold pyridoxal phosphate-dependent enzyme [Galbitalea sp. SE-J8]